MFWKRKQKVQKIVATRLNDENNTLIAAYNLVGTWFLPTIPCVGSTIKMSSGLYEVLDVHIDYITDRRYPLSDYELMEVATIIVKPTEKEFLPEKFSKKK